MNYEERLQNVSVLGAAGKMGSGILLLTALEMADLQLKPENRGKKFTLDAIDISLDALSGLHDYIRVQVKKSAEKNIVKIRHHYKDKINLIENSEIIDQYVDDVMKIILFTNRVESAYDSGLIFEAVVEDTDVKVKIIRQILEYNKTGPWFLTNTSSVPISELDAMSGLDGNIIGFHFYNPPAVQKLVELITTYRTNPDLTDFAKSFAQNLKKILVPANDFAGFIGNGHFMRDLLYGIQLAERLSDEILFTGAIYAVNRISQEFLIRPMGIFQLLDYVGIDVCQKILQVMQSRLNDNKLHSVLIDRLISHNIKGGQNPDGSQRPGILKYEKGKPVAVYDPDRKEYIQTGIIKTEADALLGDPPAMHKQWKEVISDVNRDVYLRNYFSELKVSKTKGSALAREYHLNSKSIGQALVSTGIADNAENVNTVMLTGFFHAYGPINDYLG